jgi:hypothetical protein
MTLKLKNQIREYLYKNIPADFKMWEYYKCYTTEAESYFASGHWDTSLAICLFLKENQTKPNPRNVLKFLKSKL